MNVQKNSTLVIAWEGQEENGTCQNASVTYAAHNPPNNWQKLSYSKHGKGSNFLMFDGHVEFKDDNSEYRNFDNLAGMKKVFYYD